MADPTGQEVLMWALVNRARLDPSGEAARYGINLNEGPVTDFQGNVHTITTASKQPLAWNAALFAVADQHSEDMRAQGGCSTIVKPFTKPTSRQRGIPSAHGAKTSP
jgi:hypothetical protein